MQPASLIGLMLENGNEIVDSSITSHVLRLYHEHDAALAKGFMISTLGDSKDV